MFQRSFIAGLCATLMVASSLSPIALAAPSTATPTKPATTKALSADNERVESEIIAMQQDAINEIRKALRIYSTSGMKETGKMSLSFTVGSTDINADVTFKLDEYSAITNFLKGNLAQSGRGSVKVVATQNKSDYTAKPDANYNYPKKSETISFTLNFAGEFKVVDGKLYASLTQFELAAGAILEGAPEIITGVTEIQKNYVGKYYQISDSGSMSDIGDAFAISKIESALKILETNSLLAVKAKRGNLYVMKPKTATFKAVNKALGGSSSSNDMFELPKNLEITYNSKGDSARLVLSTKAKTPGQSSGSAMISRTGESYRLDAQEKSGNRRSGSNMSLTMDSSRMTLETSDWSKYSRSDMSMNMENGMMNFSMTSNGGSFEAIKVTGPLDIMTGNADLSVEVNGKKVAAIEIKTAGNAYSMKVAGDFDEAGTKMSYKFMYDAVYETGIFDITAPVKFEKLGNNF